MSSSESPRRPLVPNFKLIAVSRIRVSSGLIYTVLIADMPQRFLFLE